jgi:hypothetical protein
MKRANRAMERILFPLKWQTKGSTTVTTQDFINFWGKIFAFVLLEMIEFPQGFKTFESN